MFHMIDPNTIFSYLRASIDFIVSEINSDKKEQSWKTMIQSNEFIEKVIHKLKNDLCIHLDKELPEIEKRTDEIIDYYLPSRSEWVENAVNELVNRMIEEIVKEIESYIKSN